MSTRIEFTAKSGAKTHGELATPDGTGSAGGVVLIQEWWGVNGHIKSLASRLADAGFLVLAPDLFHGEIATDAGRAEQLMHALDFGRAVDEVAGAVEHLRTAPRSTGKVAVVGFCMGGAVTLAAAAAIPTLSAAVPFYGIPGSADYSKLKAPVLGHFAKKDTFVTVARAQQVQKEINAAGGSMQLEVYDAQHAFVNDTRPEVYDEASAKLAWDRTIAFLRKHLA